MKLIIIHGAPNSGKTAVAAALSKQWETPIIHNQTFVDLALSVCPKQGHGDFFNFIDSVRAISIGKACKNNLEGLILTLVHTNDEAQNVRDLSKIVRMQGGSIQPIFLESADDREGPSTYNAISSPNTLVVKSDALSTDQVVAQITSKLDMR